MCYASVIDWIVSLQMSYVEALTLKVAVFEDRIFKEVTEVVRVRP